MSPPNEFPFGTAAALIRRTFDDSGTLLGVPMPGGASTRQFARFRLDSGQTLVAIHVPDANRSDEIDKPTKSNRRWPFLEIRDLLAENGIRVPNLLGESCDLGLVLVEDLGDLTLAAAIERHPEQKTNLYRTAVRDLAQAQIALSALPPDSIVGTRTFDSELLRWEIDHFRQWAMEARAIHLSPSEHAVFDEAADFLAHAIAAWPRGFVHRDYQSRNLMVRSGEADRLELTWIDFQDALLGPRVYDLVALLGDSYQTFDRGFIEARLDEYANHLRIDAAGRRELSIEFDLVTVQRKLKDAGRFIFIDRVKHNPSFLTYVEPTVDKVLAALSRLKHEPRLVALEVLLKSRLRGG